MLLLRGVWSLHCSSTRGRDEKRGWSKARAIWHGLNGRIGLKAKEILAHMSLSHFTTAFRLMPQRLAKALMLS